MPTAIRPGMRVVHIKTEGRTRGVVKALVIEETVTKVQVRVDKLPGTVITYKAENLMSEEEWEKKQ